MAFAEDNDALREAANEILAEIKQDGTIAELYQQVVQEGSAQGDPEGHAHSLLAAARRLGCPRRPLEEEQMEVVFEQYLDFGIMRDEFGFVLEGFWETLQLSLVSGALA